MINLGPYSGKNCPNVRYQPGVIDRLLEVLALLVQLALWGGSYWIYNQIGSPQSSGIWMLCGVSAFTFILLGACAYGSVGLFNFPVRVDKRNVAVQYLLAVRFLRILNVLLGLFFVAIVLKEYYNCVPVLFPVILALQGIAFIAYFVIANKYK